MRAALALVVAALAACAHNVPQDKATGEDGKVKSARSIPLEENAARVRGIVTYPGGDRIDWKKLELPKDAVGTLEMKLSWTAPRPGLVAGIDVFDAYGRQVASDKARKKLLRFRGSRKATINAATGTYLIRVYAPTRGDAAAYTLTLAFTPLPEHDKNWPPAGTVIPDPPRLPQVPPPAIVCDSTNYKAHPAECGGFCPDPVDPAWKGCAKMCPPTPDINIKACHKTMPCPDTPDTRVAACKGAVYPECPPGQVSTTCKPPKPPDPVRATIINISQNGGKVEIKLDRGLDHKVDKGWRGWLLDSSGKRVKQSDFTVHKVGKRECWGLVDLTTDQVSATKKALLSPPK